MGNLIFAVPAAVLGKLAYISLRTGSEWTRYRQWDAAATNIAIGAIFGGIAAAFAVKAVPSLD